MLSSNNKVTSFEKYFFDRTYFYQEIEWEEEVRTKEGYPPEEMLDIVNRVREELGDKFSALGDLQTRMQPLAAHEKLLSRYSARRSLGEENRGKIVHVEDQSGQSYLLKKGTMHQQLVSKKEQSDFFRGESYFQEYRPQHITEFTTSDNAVREIVKFYLGKFSISNSQDLDKTVTKKLQNVLQETSLQFDFLDADQLTRKLWSSIKENSRVKESLLKLSPQQRVTLQSMVIDYCSIRLAAHAVERHLALYRVSSQKWCQNPSIEKEIAYLEQNLDDMLHKRVKMGKQLAPFFKGDSSLKEILDYSFAHLNDLLFEDSEIQELNQKIQDILTDELKSKALDQDQRPEALSQEIVNQYLQSLHLAQMQFFFLESLIEKENVQAFQADLKEHWCQPMLIPGCSEFFMGQVLDHPNLLKTKEFYYKSIESATNPYVKSYIVCEDVQGKLLNDLNMKEVSFVNKLIILKQILSVFLYLDEQGLVYPCLPSENIMIDENFKITVIDLACISLKQSNDSDLLEVGLGMLELNLDDPCKNLDFGKLPDLEQKQNKSQVQDLLRTFGQIFRKDSPTKELTKLSQIVEDLIQILNPASTEKDVSSLVQNSLENVVGNPDSRKRPLADLFVRDLTDSNKHFKNE